MFLEKFIRFNSRYIYNALLPPACNLCGYATRRSLNICSACQKDLPILSHTCPQCAQYLLQTGTKDYTCGACQSHPPPFDRTLALFPYVAPIIQLIIALKFQHQLSHAKLFGELLADKIQTFWYQHQPLPDVILPIPLHAKCLRERGFNQAVEIARPLAKTLSLPLDLHGVQRVKHTAAQSGLLADDRKRNIANAFAARRDYRGLTVAVVDDVITTGHTMTEFCRLLKQNGAKKIDVWCCARRNIALKILGSVGNWIQHFKKR